MKKALQIGYYGLIGAVIILVALLLLLQASVIEGYEIRIVQSGSMEPELPTGSVVLIQARDRYEVGEIITFGQDRSSDLPTTHRITGDSIVGGELAYTTKGDANEESDREPVKHSEVRGRVLFGIPHLGYLLDFARQPLGFALLIGVPALLIAVEEVSSIYQATRRRRQSESLADEPTDEISDNDHDNQVK